MGIKFSEYFKLNKNQYELDFVDIFLDCGDSPFFIDPFSISKRNDQFSIDCHNYIVNFFQSVLDTINNKDHMKGISLLEHLREPNEIYFGYSIGTNPNGNGVGTKQSIDIYDALSNSRAVETGLIKNIEDSSLMIDGISRDKISDITANIIRYKLVEYTFDQCTLHNIATNEVNFGPFYNRNEKTWKYGIVKLPLNNHNDDKPILLVPKGIVRHDLELLPEKYYYNFILEHIQISEFNANSSLVRTLQTGEKKPPFKTTLKKNTKICLQKIFYFRVFARTSRFISTIQGISRQKYYTIDKRRCPRNNFNHIPH